MATSPTDFTIKEATGEKRLVTLRGRGLPFRPIVLSGSQRHDLSWYGGSPEGTMQVLGSKEEPTTIRGRWANRFISKVGDSAEIARALSDGLVAGQPPRPAGDLQDIQAPATIDHDPVDDVADLANVVDDIRRQGQQVKVAWGHIQRFGLLSKFVQKWQTTGILEWEMTFTWVSQDIGALAEVSAELGSFDPKAAVDRVYDELDNIGGSAIPSINSIISNIQDAVFELEDTAFVGVQGIQNSIQLAKRSSSIYDFMMRRAIDLLLAVRNIEEAAAFNDEEDVGDRLATLKASRDRRQAASRLGGIAAEQQAAIASQVNPELVRVFVAREGQDLREVSTTHYGTPDSWQSLLLFNGLDSSKLSSGQLVFVPRTPPAVRC